MGSDRRDRRTTDKLGVLRVERLIGWLSFAVGTSALQPNDSVFFQVVYMTAEPYLVVALFMILGLLLVTLTHVENSRCRIVVMLLLALMWGGGLALVISSGPLGAFGSAAIVILCHLIGVLWAKVHGSTTA